MFIPLTIGIVFALVTMAIQIAAVVFMLQYLIRVIEDENPKRVGMRMNAYVISVVMLMLFTAHMIQIAIWALLFMQLGEFSDFMTAFYHSMVNFTSLGYGDIVMSEDWRLLGAIEASNGVLMFGLTAGTVLSVMGYLLTALSPLAEHFSNAKNN